MNRAKETLWLMSLPLVLFGCAQNSIFELTLNIAPAPQTAPDVMMSLRDKVLIEARSGDASFGADWQQTQITGIVLDNAPNNTVVASFGGSGAELEQPLRVKVRFCVDPRCTNVEAADGGAPEIWYEFDRVFYQGRYTHYELDIMEFPTTEPMDEDADVNGVDKCAIVGEGCWEGATDNNCLADGRHFCEDA
jgi:hypothetical protein